MQHISVVQLELFQEVDICFLLTFIKKRKKKQIDKSDDLYVFNIFLIFDHELFMRHP